MLIDVAVMAPVVLAEPTLRTHFPTARSVAAADSWILTLTDGLAVTVTLLVVWVRGLVSWTVMVEPLIDVTVPNAALSPAKRPRNPPEPDLPDDPPALPGVPPPEPNPPGGRPPDPPKPPPPPPGPAVQLPETGWLTRMDVAVTEVGSVLPVVDELDELGRAPVAVMHDPTVTLDTDPLTAWLNVVDEV
jgi:hypothetical protein